MIHFFIFQLETKLQPQFIFLEFQKFPTNCTHTKDVVLRLKWYSSSAACMTQLKLEQPHTDLEATVSASDLTEPYMTYSAHYHKTRKNDGLNI